MKIGRNDPCPCGSGIKYTKCCAGKQNPGEESTGPHDILGELKKALQGQRFGSLEEADAFAADFMEQHQQAPVDDFHGLSPDQMHRCLYSPFESPSFVTFPSPPDAALDAPIMSCFRMLAEAIGDQGLKPTATGNLPRTFCRAAWEAFPAKEGSDSWAALGPLSTERDFYEMHTTRMVAEVAGFVRKYKGKLILGSECRKILAKEGPAGMYQPLFRAAASKFNWGCQDAYPELYFIQQSFLFTLYLLARYGGEWREKTFYEDAYLQAFPAVLYEVQSDAVLSAETRLRNAYSVRILQRFAKMMGLVEIERAKDNRGWNVRKLPLLDHVVQFHP